MLIFWREKLQNLMDFLQQVDERIKINVVGFQNIKKIVYHMKKI